MTGVENPREYGKAPSHPPGPAAHRTPHGVGAQVRDPRTATALHAERTVSALGEPAQNTHGGAQHFAERIPDCASSACGSAAPSAACCRSVFSYSAASARSRAMWSVGRIRSLRTRSVSKWSSSATFQSVRIGSPVPSVPRGEPADCPHPRDERPGWLHNPAIPSRRHDRPGRNAYLVPGWLHCWSLFWLRPGRPFQSPPRCG